MLSAKRKVIQITLTSYGELSERFKELVLKTSDSERNLGFESLTLRQQRSIHGMFLCFLLLTPVIY